MAEQRTTPPPSSSHPAAESRPQPPRRSWLAVTLRRTLFWLVLLGVMLYAAQVWWLKQGALPADPAASGAASAASADASGVAAGVAASSPASAASSGALMPDTAASASSPAMASPATAASSPSTGASASQATTAAMAADVNAVPAPQSGASAPAISPVTDAEVAELAARKLLIPVDGVKAAQLQDTYTQSRSNGRLHEAIDIMAPAGTPVRAVENGRIVKLFNSAAGGITVYQFDPASQYGYYYAHLQGYAEGLQEGQEVRRGDVIGYVGSTGNADAAAPHLHFAAFKLGPERNWWRGAYLNPYRLWR